MTASALLSRPARYPLLAGVLALIVAGALHAAPAGTTVPPKAAAVPPAPAEDGAAKPAGSAADAAKTPLEKMLDEKKYQDVILEVEKKRAASPGKKVADADSEFTAAQAQARLKLYDAARERFQLIAKEYPTGPRAGEATVEASVCLLRKLDDLGPNNPDKSLALQAAKECEAAAKQFASDPKTAGRAWYVAGNAWRLGGEDKLAKAAYEQGRLQPAAGDGEYPQKSLYMLGILAARDFRRDDARSLFTECSMKYPSASTFDRCQKGLARLDIVGSPAPKLAVETWLNSPPVEVESLKGKVVIVWFWETWCPHCQDTMPVMAGFVTRYKDKPFAIVGLTNNTRGQTTESAKAFVADPHWQISWPAAVDLEGRTGEAYATGGSAPAAVLIDKKGIIRWADHPTYLSAAMIDKLLAE